MTTSLETRIEALWSAREEIDAGDPEVRATIDEAIGRLDDGRERIAQVGADGEVTVNTWLKQAIMLLF